MFKAICSIFKSIDSIASTAAREADLAVLELAEQRIKTSKVRVNEALAFDKSAVSSYEKEQAKCLLAIRYGIEKISSDSAKEILAESGIQLEDGQKLKGK